MKEIIEALNNTGALRTVFYCIVFIIALSVIVDGIADIIKAFKK